MIHDMTVVMQRRTSQLDAIPVGLYEKALPPELSWSERLMASAEAGYDFVEISIDDSDERIARLDWGAARRAALRQAVRDTNVGIKSMSLSAHRRFPMGSASAATRQRGIDILKKAVDFTVDTGIRYILICGAEAYHETYDDGTEARWLEGLEAGFLHASGAGVMLALENWDVGITSIRKAMQIVEHFDSPWLQLYSDIGNLAYAGHDVIDEMAAGKGHIAAVHAKDTLQGQLRYVPPGEGEVPFTEAFATLAEIGFQGPVVLELWTGGEPDAASLARQASIFVRHHMAEGWARYHASLNDKKGAAIPT
jgi:L-ribulose-5-phosphate 3-epimerase